MLGPRNKTPVVPWPAAEVVCDAREVCSGEGGGVGASTNEIAYFPTRTKIPLPLASFGNLGDIPPLPR